MHGELVTGIHQQRFRVRHKRIQRCQLRAGRPGRDSILLYEREVDGFEALVVAVGKLEGAREAVDIQGRAPVSVVAAWRVNEGRHTGRVKLQLHEGAPRSWIDVGG